MLTVTRKVDGAPLMLTELHFASDGTIYEICVCDATSKKLVYKPDDITETIIIGIQTEAISL